MRREIILPVIALLFLGVNLTATRKAPTGCNQNPATTFICNSIKFTEKGHLRITAQEIGSTERSKVLIYTPNLKIQPGDTLQLKFPEFKKIVNRDSSFDYGSYMARRKIFYQAWVPSKRIQVIKAEELAFPHKMARTRIRLQEKLQDLIIDRDAQSIVIALSSGDKNLISRNLKEKYAQSGASHVLALSGLHVGIIYKILNYLLIFLSTSPNLKKLKSLFILCMLWLYTFFTGMGPSILRATIMTTIYEFGTLAGRDKNSLNALSLSAIIILIIDPQSSHSMSFMLSFEAMLGIILFYPILKKETEKMPFARPMRYILNSCLLSISCQILTAPHIYLVFGSYSFYTLLCNILIMPIISMVMILIPIMLAGSSISFLERETACVIEFLISVLNRIVDIIFQLNVPWEHR